MSEPPVSLEDLLKLKQHETPQREFWDGFERDFQHRRLRALMDSEGRSGRFNFGFLRQLLVWSPVAGGAMAVAALAFVSSPGNGLSHRGDSLPSQQELATSAGLAPAFESNAESPSPRPVRAAATSTPSFGEPERSHFVIDALASQEETRSFRRILSNVSLNVPTSVGSRYVADPLTSARAEMPVAVHGSPAHF